jgi:hypothetical protein
MQVLRIADRDERGYLSVGLKELLSVVTREGPDLSWVLQDLHVSGDLGKDWTVQKLEQATRQAPFGLRLSWSELTDLAQKLTQIQDGLVIGLPPESAPPAINKGPMDIDAYVVFEAVDSSYWEVHSFDEELLEQIRSRFRNVTVVPTVQ